MLSWMTALSVGVTAARGAGLLAILRLDRATEAEPRVAREERWTRVI